jgi:hypothetical protein
LRAAWLSGGGGIGQRQIGHRPTCGIKRVRAISWSMQSDDEGRKNWPSYLRYDGGNGVVDAPTAKRFLCRNSCATMLRRHSLFLCRGTLFLFGEQKTCRHTFLCLIRMALTGRQVEEYHTNRLEEKGACYMSPFWNHIYAEPQHKLLFRVVRGGGGDFWAPFWIYLCMYVSMYLSSGKFKFFERAGISSLALVNKNWENFLSIYSTREAFFIRSINFESAGNLSIPEFCLSLSWIKIEKFSYLHTLPEKLFY